MVSQEKASVSAHDRKAGKGTGRKKSKEDKMAVLDPHNEGSGYVIYNNDHM